MRCKVDKTIQSDINIIFCLGFLLEPFIISHEIGVMSNSFNVNIAVECLKNIVDSNRCAICDKSEGSRSRYTCGHTSCDDCVDRAGDCLLCLTPPVTATDPPVTDDPLTRRANNATQLLEACQEAFNVDVYRRQRLSEQLKTEKELFPECIQAPLKYFNKRKSSIGSPKNKENRRRSIYPGEQISPYKGSKMEKSAYIKQWIEQNENALTKSPRKPFADLNLNRQRVYPRCSKPLKKRVDVMLDKVHENSENTRKLPTRKRSHFNTTLSMVNSQSKLDKFLKQDNSDESSKRLNKKFDQHENSTMKRFNKHDKDESGIVADVEPIVIEDSQSENIDKDKQAWLAVLEAENNETSKSSSKMRLECSEIIKYTDDVEGTLCEPTEFSILEESIVCNKVPFYKKSYLLEKCKRCVVNNKLETSQNETHSKDISITIESSSFVTTIKVCNNAHNNLKPITATSVPVQTDIHGLVEANNKVSQKNLDAEQKHCSNLVLEEHQKSSNVEDYLLSQDLFTCEANDSDSDGEVNQSRIIQVIADVHKSSDQLEYTPYEHHTEEQRSVLAELDENEHQLRTKHNNRGTTPGSTDSSEKENYDPNRQKRMKFSKKDLKKKRNREKQDLIEFDFI